MADTTQFYLDLIDWGGRAGAPPTLGGRPAHLEGRQGEAGHGGGILGGIDGSSWKSIRLGTALSACV